jgi:single-stranded-DNA-specific exonuclease
MQKKWFVRKTNPEFVSYLARESSVSPALAQVLINRGINTPEDVKLFLECTTSDMRDPYEFKGMKEAVSAIKKAREENVKILVHGDYDCDGITATSIMVESLRACGLSVSYFIPNRFDHGYGFNLAGLEYAKEAGAAIIVTVDCGVTAFETAAAAAKAGIGLVITDHHEPQLNEQTQEPELPEALAIVNPKLETLEENAPTLAGAGVALMFAHALCKEMGVNVEPTRWYDLAALGTLADSVRLLKDNRIIVREGARQIIERKRLGIAALMDVSGLTPERIKPGRLQFTIVPRINAVGRLKDAGVAVELMLATAPGEAASLAHELDKCNVERKSIEEQVFKEACSVVEKKGIQPVLVLAGEGWHEGVVGIVASKLVDRYHRPAIVLCIKGERTKGSARSIEGFDIHGVLTECSDKLIAFGGHKQAAGLTLLTKDLAVFEDALIKAAKTGVEEIEHELALDASVSLEDISFKLVEELSRLEPFGQGNPEPLLGAKGLEVVNARIVGNGHLKMRLRSNSTYMEAIGFNMGDSLQTVEDTLAIDAAFSATVNVWEDRRNLQLNLKALKKSEDSASSI